MEEKSKKSVSWSENLENNETILRQQREIQELKEQMAEIKRDIRSLKEVLPTNHNPLETPKFDKKPVVDVNLV
jgi:hypothetical protein